MAPFLSVITRASRRPTMLGVNQESLAQQTCQDYEQILIVDNEGLGMYAANRALADAGPTGEYVMVLDDDDMLTDPEAIARLKQATRNAPALVIFRADHDFLGLLPTRLVWQKHPIKGQIGSCDFITRRDWWEQHISAFGTKVAGDYHFLASMWDCAPDVVWLDRELAGVQRISGGKPEWRM